MPSRLMDLLIFSLYNRSETSVQTLLTLWHVDRCHEHVTPTLVLPVSRASQVFALYVIMLVCSRKARYDSSTPFYQTKISSIKIPLSAKGNFGIQHLISLGTLLVFKVPLD